MIIKFLKKNFIAIILAVGLLIAGQQLLNSFQKNKRLHTELIGKTEEYKQLTKHSALLGIQYKNETELREKLEKEWKAEKSELIGKIKVLSNATFLIREKARVNNSSDLVYNGNKLKYVVNEIKFNNGPPVGYVLIFDNGKVTSKLYNHIIDVKTAITRDESSGKYKIASKANFVLKSPSLNLKGENWYNKPFSLEIIGGTALIDPTEPTADTSKRFFVWSPNFNIGIDFHLKGPRPTLGFSIMGYGYSPRDLDWKFLQIGVDYSDNTGVSLNVLPVLYRPFPRILRNTYIGLGISFSNTKFDPFFGISIGF